ncbi:unnamed protein product [Brassica napus]|uniref:MATH domain-containing protein n=2 Tax=Brassica TaxID=3705 RepID=A0A3P6EZ98_BRAOL|nr:unnamed protein product [Brassica napus]VDD45328.1 unnamed protein product [Brassica oleracea]
MLKKEKSCFVSDSTITSKFGDRPPSTYSMKIQNLSQLKTLFSETGGYKSRTFSSGKYNWRLVIYPNGNEKDNGTGFISTYVELDSTALESTVLAYLTFFVYNKKENKYFTIQERLTRNLQEDQNTLRIGTGPIKLGLGDVEGKQFNALRPVRGFPQVLPLDTFNDPKNGYVFNGDQCEFGVDVMKPSNPKFSWTVNKFSKLKEHHYISSKFLIGGRNWVLELYPKGYNTTYSTWLSLFLHLAEGEKMKTGEEIYTQCCDLRILDPFGCNHMTRKSATECWITKSHGSYQILPLLACLEIVLLTYSMKIQNLSQLKTSLSGSDVYKSRTFSSGKYNWRLVIYPKGNKKDNGAGFNFTLWKPFNALRPVHGFPQVLPLDTFNDYKDGYAFDGNQWEFSVDVMVRLTNWEVVSFTQKPSKPDFCWTVNKFSKLKEHRYGHVVVSQGRDYIRSQIDIHLSEVKPDKDTLKAGEQIYTKADVRILTHLESLDKEV